MVGGNGDEGGRGALLNTSTYEDDGMMGEERNM